MPRKVVSVSQAENKESQQQQFSSSHVCRQRPSTRRPDDRMAVPFLDYGIPRSILSNQGEKQRSANLNWSRPRRPLYKALLFIFCSLFSPFTMGALLSELLAAKPSHIILWSVVWFIFCAFSIIFVYITQYF